MYKAAGKATRVTRAHAEQVQQLLNLLGIPWVRAPAEAEATCAWLVKGGKAFAAVTEDMDVLTFGTLRMVKASDPSLILLRLCCVSVGSQSTGSMHFIVSHYSVYSLHLLYDSLSH